MTLPTYTPNDWYWIIAGDKSRIWSSVVGGYISEGDVKYATWLKGGGRPTPVASEEELDEVLVAAGRGDSAPHPPKRTVLKSVIVSRLIAAGKIGAAKSALDADPAAFARWFATDRPAINYDDSDALKLLRAIGADPDVILA